MGDQDSDSEAMSQPEVATVSKVIKNKKRKKKKKAHKRRREALKKKARSWNTTKGLLCCCRHFFVLNRNEFCDLANGDFGLGSGTDFFGRGRASLESLGLRPRDII